MKLFKKLMATALAGVMALSMLTGCANVVGKKEIVNYLNDTKALAEVYNPKATNPNDWQIKTGVKTIEPGDDKLAQEVLSKVNTYAENHSYKNQRTVSAAAAEALRAACAWNDEHYADIAKIVPEKSKDAYYIAYAEVTKFQSKEYQNTRDAVIAQDLAANTSVLYMPDEADLGDKAVASIATKEIGGDTYIVVVYVQAAKAAK